MEISEVLSIHARGGPLIATQILFGFDRPRIVAHSAAGLLMPALAREMDATHHVWLAAAVAD